MINTLGMYITSELQKHIVSGIPVIIHFFYGKPYKNYSSILRFFKRSSSENNNIFSQLHIVVFNYPSFIFTSTYLKDIQIYSVKELNEFFCTGYSEHLKGF